MGQSVLSAIQETKKSKDDKELRLYFHRDVFFEINGFLKNYSQTERWDLKSIHDTPLEASLTLKEGKRGILESHQKDNLYDIMICDMLSAVSTVVPKRIEFPIESLIETQLALLQFC